MQLGRESFSEDPTSPGARDHPVHNGSSEGKCLSDSNCGFTKENVVCPGVVSLYGWYPTLPC